MKENIDQGQLAEAQSKCASCLLISVSLQLLQASLYNAPLPTMHRPCEDICSIYFSCIYYCERHYIPSFELQIDAEKVQSWLFDLTCQKRARALQANQASKQLKLLYVDRLALASLPSSSHLDRFISSVSTFSLCCCNSTSLPKAHSHKAVFSLSRMETVRPRPIRPYDKELSPHLPRQDNIKHSKSTADLSSLSRTSSFLSFAGLESLKSSALFGIFEKGGYESEPPTPDLAGSKHYDYHLSSSVIPDDPHEVRANHLLSAVKLSGVAIVAFTFISLFNQIPSTNRYCSISPAQGTNPLLYTLAATFVAAVFPLLNQLVASSSTSMPQRMPVETKAGLSVDPTGSVESSRMQRTSSSWSFNVLLRYFAGFLGLAYAGTKLDFPQPSQFNICVGLVSLCANVILIRSVSGLVSSLVLTGVFTAMYAAIVRVPQQDFIGATLLIWLNVLVYGSLGKMMRIVQWKALN